ncbi:hypothetical protein B0H14DRAFT_3522359 [Mycena olivaceomarginata]|nr:hypothetical protein B0H14DRAFT_3522359 [Mycena olivaceomarginata]
MAQKRAEKKAKRRLSDKPTIKSEPTTGIARARARARRRAEAALTIANDVNATQIESRPVSDAERDASESLVLMSKLHTPKPAIRNISPDIFEHWQDSPRVYEGGNSNSADSEEDEMGVRTISDVAGSHPEPGTLQSLEGMQEDLHEEQAQSPKHTCTREASVSDACFRSWLQPVFGGSDAKFD